jgi:Tfp pilus assembly protein PilX
MIFSNCNLKARQQGAATLLVVAVLALIMAVMALTTAQTGLMEQKITGNDLRAREVQEAAEAGLEYGVGWAKKNSIPNTVTCSSGALPAGCPTALTTVTGSSTGESYAYALTFTKGTDSIRVTSAAQGVADSSIAATSEAWIKQIPNSLFGTGMKMPPPLVAAACITNTLGGPNAYVLNPGNTVAASGYSADGTCLPQGNMDVNQWTDDDGDGVQDAGEVGGTDSYNVATFPGCPADHCVWNHYFEMSLEDAMQAATSAGHVYTNDIPCGAPSSSPSIYIINNSGPINSADIDGTCSGNGIDSKTIGAPKKPVLLIIPEDYDCPKFNGSITVYGIIYYETTTACNTNGFGGADVYGSVMIEGSGKKFNANTKFIEVDHGSGDDLNSTFEMGIDDTTRIPGTWKDF